MMRKIFDSVLVSVVLAFAVGCADKTSCEGQEGCECRADGTCDPGLVCFEGVCIYYTPPPDPTGEAEAGAGAGGEQPPSNGGSTSPPPETNALPDMCQSVLQQWDAECESWEDELIQAINERRAAGAVCGTLGAKPPAPALVKNESLQCAARLNSKDIVDIGEVILESEQNGSATDRARAAGYKGGTVGENIHIQTETNRTPASSVVDTWMGLETSCRNIMDTESTDIGAGCFQISDADTATVKIHLACIIQIGVPIVEE
jgi:uncharacterized protein YkwD